MNSFENFPGNDTNETEDDQVSEVVPVTGKKLNNDQILEVAEIAEKAPNEEEIKELNRIKTEEISNLPDELKEVADDYMSMDYSPGAALREARGQEEINNLPDNQREIAEELRKDMSPTKALRTFRNQQENTQ